MNSGICEQFFAVLADRNRLAIVDLILEKELTVTEIAKILGLEQSLVSHHLKMLKDHGFVDFKSDGKKRLYSSNKDTMRPVMDIMRAHTKKFCGFVCEYKVDEWVKMNPVKSINHETEVIMEKIKLLRKYMKSKDKTKSKNGLIQVAKFFNETMNRHFEAEELTLFKTMKNKGNEIVEDLIIEHKILRKKFIELKNVVESYDGNDKTVKNLEEITESINKIIKSHIVKEEEILIPEAKRVLSKEEFEEIEKRVEELETSV